jgi:predicted CXXCH cytochrome family protein
MGTTRKSCWAARLLAFATVLLLLGSMDFQLPIVGIALGAVHFARARFPAGGRAGTKAAGRGRNAHLIMLSAGALVVLVAVLAVNALPGPENGPGGHAGPRETSTYKGVEYCLKCHGPDGTGGDQYTGWRATAHGADFSNITHRGINRDLYAEQNGSCQPCHVVGYNITDIGGFDPAMPHNSGSNSGLLGVQCEDCHGPGSDLCEVCHGPPVDHSHQATNMVEKPSPEQSCSGGFSGAACHGPGGRDVYTSWAHSTHSPAEQREQASPQGLNTVCARCKSPSQYDPAVSPENASAIAREEWRGIECADCHSSHDNRYKGQLKAAPDELCGGCHNSEYAAPAPGKAPLHPQLEMVLGRLGANVTGTRGMPGASCSDCHGWDTPAVAPGVNLSDIAGYPYPLHERHLFTSTPEACADCHSDLSLSMPNTTMPANKQGANASAYAAWEKWMPRWLGEVGKWNAATLEWQTEIRALMSVAGPEISAARDEIDSARANGTKDAATLARAEALWGDAYWNYNLVGNDKSDGVHNHDFALALLDDALPKAREALALVRANTPPTADAGPGRLAFKGEPVFFDGSGSSDIDGVIASYIWDFGDGTSAAGRTASHSYNVTGLYHVTLTVTDDRGALATAAIYVIVNEPEAGNLPPVAQAGDDRTAAPGAVVVFNGSGSSDADGTIAAWAWSFGDGAVGAGAIVEHSYVNAGVYAVALIVTDDRGARGFDVAITDVRLPMELPVDLAPLEENLTSLSAALDDATRAVAGVEDDIASVKADISGAKKDASGMKRSVDSLKNDLGVYAVIGMAVMLAVACALVIVSAVRSRPPQKRTGTANGRVRAGTRGADGRKGVRKKPRRDEEE